MLAGSDGKVAALAWTSIKVQRVVGSTMAADALSLQMAMSHTIYLREVLAETLGVEATALPIKSFIDSNNLYQAAKLTKSVEDRRLRLDIAQIEECVKKSGVKVLWVQADEMLAYCLTKRGGKADGLMDVITSGN